MRPVDRFDLHVHSRHSRDGAATVEALVGQAIAAGLRGFALTDHNTVAGHPELERLQAARPELVLVPGVEVSTADGHLLAYSVAEAPPPHRPLAETVAWVRDRGGVTVLAHPARWTHGAGIPRARSAPVDGIEEANGHSSAAANARATGVAEARRIAGTGGSDAHAVAELGRAYTECEGPVRDRQALLGAVRSARTRGHGRSLAGWERATWLARVSVLRLGRGLRAI